MLDQIVITVGKSELPALVAARALTKKTPSAQLTWICADEPSALDEVKRVENELGITGQKLQVNPYVPHEIVKALKKQFPQERTGRVFINYTGGTKAMSLHVIDYISGTADHFEPSYLSATTHCIYFGINTGEDQRRTWNPAMTVQALAELHGWQTMLPQAKAHSEVLVQRQAATHNALNEALSDRIGNYNLQSSLFFERDGSTVAFDVAAVLGYQLILVKISANNSRSLCKKEAFEVLHRARQLGGNAAQAVLLCGLLPTVDKNDMERDLRTDSGPFEPITVWGSEITDDPARLKNEFDRLLDNLNWIKR